MRRMRGYLAIVIWLGFAAAPFYQSAVTLSERLAA